jgi:hypothetical protein
VGVGVAPGSTPRRHDPNRYRGLALYKDRLNYGKTQWHYFYAESKGNHHPMS